MKNLKYQPVFWISAIILMASLFVLTGEQCTNQALALKKLPPELTPGLEEGQVVFPPSCKRDIRIIFNLRNRGFKIPGTRQELEVIGPRYIIYNPQISGGCNTNVQNFNGPFTWELLTKPQGSNAVLQNTESFKPHFFPDQPGDYQIRFSACPNGCEFVYQEGDRVIAGPVNEVLTLTVTDEEAIPPATEAIKPNQNPVGRSNIQSSHTGGFYDPQWLTINPWNGPQDYRLLEGQVASSNPSRKDNFLNHHYQDFVFQVKPDPAFTNLLPRVANTNGRIEVEWERVSLPEPFFPTRGDRSSVVGYWVWDCGHSPVNTEIHPPVMVASHRARPVRLDILGSNLIVPGIVSHLYLNEDAGEITGNCSRTGLHDRGDCLPDRRGFNANPIKRIYNYKIYLPKNPRLMYQDAGLPPPPQVPLFFKIYNPNGSSGPDPLITANITGGYLDVQIDLRNYNEGQYSRRIEAAWALPSPDNWGLRSWKVQLNELDVHNDGDSDGDGDWRFWANINNGQQEWTKMFDCDGCVHGTINFANNPWATGINGDRSLGPDVLLFPNQKIWVHTTGYEDDSAVSDFTGRVAELLPQIPGNYSSQSHCTASGYSNCCSYTLSYEISPGTPLATPQLNAEGRQLYNSYLINQRTLGEAVFPNQVLANWFHPMTDDLDLPDSMKIDFYDERFFPVQEEEQNNIVDMSNEVFAQKITELQKESPDKFIGLIEEFKVEVRDRFERKGKNEALLTLETLEEAMPADIWQAHFSNFKLDSQSWISGISNELLIGIVLGILLLVIIFFIRKK